MRSTSTLTRPRRRSLRREKRDRYVEVNGLKVRYREEGAQIGGTPLLMVHGFNGSCDYFFPHPAPMLGEERHVIVVDLPGNGLSARMPAHNFAAYVDFIIGFLDALEIGQADILGH